MVDRLFQSPAAFRENASMLSPKKLLLAQVDEAFRGRPDMPLMAALDGVTQQAASWQPDATIPSIEQLIRHIAWSKSRFCQRGFARPMPIIDSNVNDDGDSPDSTEDFPCGAAWGLEAAPGIAGAVRLLEEAQKIFRECLESLPDDALEKPIPTHHGKSAANFFWVMLMHDLYHAGQIRTRRTIHGLRAK
jgi:hypothetical protein